MAERGKLFLAGVGAIGVNLRQLLSKLRWDPREDFAETTIRYLDRNKDDRGNTIPRIVSFKGKEVLEVTGGYMTVRRDGELSHIPLHRVREVVLPGGKVVWKHGG